MPGIPTHFKILELTIDKLKASNKPDLMDMARIMEKKENRAFAFLGAIGPSLADFMPANQQNPYMELWQKIFLFVGGDGQLPGLYALIKKLRDYLDKVDPAIAAQDLDALKALDNETQSIRDEVAPQLQETLDKAKITQLLTDIETLALTKNMPTVMAVGAQDPAPAPEKWRAREFLFWKKTGKFAKALVAVGEKSGNEQFRAYAYGYLTSYAGKVCGSPFINSIVWAPYRLHWWRHRWINNFVDTWVYGKYVSGATMNQDNPSLPYEQWPKLCDADLQRNIEIPDVKMDPVAIMNAIRDGTPLPELSASFANFVELWMQAFHQVYGTKPFPPEFTGQALQDAYQATWLMLWFQTSGEVLSCNPPPNQLVPPSNCDQPAWVDPSLPPGSSTGSQPPPPDPGAYTETDTAKKVTGILLAILGGVVVLGGGLAEGAGGLAGGIWLATHADEVDWDKLACYMYWLRWYYYNLLEALIEIFAQGGIIYPSPYMLASLVRENPNDPATAVINAIKVVKSRKAVDQYPAIWLPLQNPPYGGVKDFTADPQNYQFLQYTDPATGLLQSYKILVEWLKILNITPKTRGYLEARYPDFFVDDPNNPLGDAGVRVGGNWPVRGGVAEPVQFGNAVENAVDLLSNLGVDLPDWNLDGDRGLAYFTWIFKSVPHAIPIEIAPEP